MAEYDRESLPPSTEEIADGVEASTTDATVQSNLDAAVTSRAPAGDGFNGLQATYDMAFTQPSHTTTSATGGGTVGFNNYGCQLSAGTTAGDTAYLELADYVEELAAVNRLGIVYKTHGSTVDDMEVGLLYQGVNTTTNGVYFDLTDGQYVFEGSTQAASVDPTANAHRPGVLLIEQDAVNGQTTIYHAASGNSEKVTFAGHTRGRGAIAGCVSNGNGDNLDILQASLEWGTEAVL